MSDKKEGIELILDRAEALRVRIEQTREQAMVPPTTQLDQRLSDMLYSWSQLAKDVVTEATRMKLQAEYQPLRTVYAALDRISALMALPADTAPPEVVKAVQIALKRLQELETKIVNFREASTPPSGVPQTPKLNGELRGVHAYIRGEEPRPSYVLERLEALVLGGWLDDAVRNLERVAEYMRANEERMSEDVFDELGRIADKLARWAHEVTSGNMFPGS